MAGTTKRLSRSGHGVTTSASAAPPTSRSYVDGTPRWCSTLIAVDALPCGSRSTTRTRCPNWASAAATLTVEVVLPTPPFWLATTTTRVRAGRASAARVRAPCRASSVCSAALRQGCGLVAEPARRCGLEVGEVGRRSHGEVMDGMFHVKHGCHRTVENSRPPVERHAPRPRGDRWITLAPPRPESAPSPVPPPLRRSTRGATLLAPDPHEPPGPPSWWKARAPAGCGRHVDAQLEHLGRGTAAASAGSGRPRRISSSRDRPFIASSTPSGADQRHRPGEQPVQGRQGPGGHDVEDPLAVQRLGAAPHDLDG